MFPFMAKRYEDQVCLKLTGQLRAHLEDEAAARGRSLSNLIRKILFDHTMAQIAENASKAA